MKKVMCTILLAGAAVMCVQAEDFTGYIVDKSCSSKDKTMWSDEACVARCLKRGDPAMFVTEDGKIFKVTEQAKVKDFGGKKVTVTGKLKDDTLSVDSIKAN